MANIEFHTKPASFGDCTGTVSTTDDGRHLVDMVIVPSGGTDTSLSSGTDVVLVLDASFSMYAGLYRNAKVLQFVESMIKFMSPYDDDGIDVYLHSLKKEPFRHMGAFSDSEEVQSHLGMYMEAKTAMMEMGQRTVCAPVIHDIVRRLKEDKGSDRVFIEIVTDGVFDDQEEVLNAIVEYGRKYNTEEAPYGIRFHFTGVGPQGSSGIEFLSHLDNDLADKYPGFIDCVQHDSATSVEDNVNTIVKELESTIRLSADNVMISVSDADGQAPQSIRLLDDGAWTPQNEQSIEGGMPVRIPISAVFTEPPAGVRLQLQFVDEEGNYHEQEALGRVA